MKKNLKLDPKIQLSYVLNNKPKVSDDGRWSGAFLIFFVCLKKTIFENNQLQNVTILIFYKKYLWSSVRQIYSLKIWFGST